MNRLIDFGGFPEPFLKNSSTFAKRFRRIHTDTIIREDLLDLERVRDIKSIEILIDLLRARVGSTTSYTTPEMLMVIWGQNWKIPSPALYCASFTL